MEKHYEEKDQTPTLIDGGQVDEAIVNTPPTEKGVFNTGITTTQIEQVVDLPIPTTDDSGKVLKVDADGKWELSTDSEGTVVVANPTLAGTETNLTGLQVGATKYKVPQGMEVVEIVSYDGTFNDEDYAKVSGNNCVILYGGELYYKTLENPYALSYTLPSIRLQNDGSITKIQIEISTEDKSYSVIDYSSVVGNPTFDGSEIALTGIEIAGQQYKVGGSEVLAYEGTSLLPTDVVFENWTLHRAIKDGNILWIVLSGEVKNNGSDTATVNNYFSITLNTDISSKIYRQDGTTCNNAKSSNNRILRFNGMSGDNSTTFDLNSDSANVIYVRSRSNVGLGAGDSMILDVRIPIFLDIGTVQQ